MTLRRRFAPIFQASISTRLVFGLVFLMFVGSSALMLPWMQHRDLTWDQAVFTAASALTVTGLSTITAATDLTVLGQIVLAVLIQVGGVGYTVLAVITFRVLGRSVTLADRLALTDSLGLLNPGGILALTRQVLVMVLSIELIGALLLAFHWRGLMPPDQLALYSAFHAVSAYCNAGFDLFTGHPALGPGIPTDPFTLTVFGALIFVGGLGIPVLFDLATNFGRRRLSLHTRITLPVVLFLVTVGTLGIFFSEARQGGVLADIPLGRQLGYSLFQSISARTAGFAGLPNFEAMAPATQLLLIWLMFIGCAPASMGGGITTGTFAVLSLAVWGYTRGMDTPMVGGRAIPGEMIRKAAVVLTLAIFFVILGIFLILLTHKAPLNVAAFEVVSAFATCGLSLNFTGELTVFGQAVIVFMMFGGRLGPLTLLFALQQSRKVRRVRLPEEKVLIG